MQRGDLHDKLDGQPRKHQILKQLLDVARALVFLHEQNIVHCDLTSRNILLRKAEDGTIVAKVAPSLSAL